MKNIEDFLKDDLYYNQIKDASEKNEYRIAMSKTTMFAFYELSVAIDDFCKCVKSEFIKVCKKMRYK